MQMKNVPWFTRTSIPFLMSALLLVSACSSHRAFILSDDNDVGYRTSTDALVSQLRTIDYAVSRVNSNWEQTVKDGALFWGWGEGSKVVLIVINAHGWSDVSKSKWSFTGPSEWGKHKATIGQGDTTEVVTTEKLADIAKWLRDKGVDVVIIDNSCGGGATVKQIEHDFPGDDRICSIASTGTITPSVVGVPRWQEVIGDPRYRHWNYDALGLWASGLLTNMAQQNYRVHQYGYMNGCSDTMSLREAMSIALVSMSTWPEYNRKRHYHVYLNPERYYAGSSNPGDPNYGPPPDDVSANNGYQQEALPAIDNLALRASFRLWLVPMNAEHRDTLRRMIFDELIPMLKNWGQVQIAADYITKTEQVCGINLDETVRALLSYSKECGISSLFGMAYGSANCSERDAENLEKYLMMVCENRDGVVPEVLNDYPVTGAAIQGLINAEQIAKDKAAEVSTYLYSNIEGSICKPRGCSSIKISESQD